MSLLLTAVVVTAMLLCAAVARLGGAAAEKARANNAADASALAAADRLALGQSSAQACAIARETATDNGARLLTCRFRAGAATSGTTGVDVTLEIGGAHAHSRAEVDASADAS